MGTVRTLQQPVFGGVPDADRSGVPEMGGTILGSRGGMQTQPVGPPVELNPTGQPAQPALPPAIWGNAQGQQFQGGYGDTSQPLPPALPPAIWGNAQGQQFLGGYGDTSQPIPRGYANPYQSNTGGSGPIWPGSPQDRMRQMGQSSQGGYQQAPLGRIRSSPMPQWGQGMMFGSPLDQMRQAAPSSQASPTAYSGGLGQLAGRNPWPPQGGLVR